MTDQPRRGRPPSGARADILTATLEVLREHGVARLTTREVARQAGVSEGSIFYHFGDRTGLLLATFTWTLEPLMALNAGGFEGTADVRGTLLRFARTLEEFLSSAIDVLTAAQSDAELREALAEHMRANDFGPHRGIAWVAGYLRTEQAAGRIRDDADSQTTAFLLISACFQRSTQRRLIGHVLGLPPLESVVDNLVDLLTPT